MTTSHFSFCACLLLASSFFAPSALAQPLGQPDRGAPGDEMIQAYMAAETAKLSAAFTDDVKSLAVPVLGHRIIVTADAAMTGRDTAAVIGDILAAVDVPIAERE